MAYTANILTYNNRVILNNSLPLDGLMAYYKLDGNANDYLGINNGVTTNVTYSGGIINQGAIFNGTSSLLINDSNSFTLGSNDFGFSLWAKRNTISSRQGLMGQSNSGGSNITISFFIEFQSDNTVRGAILNGVSSIYSVTSITTITDNNFHNIIFTRNNNILYLYIDGIQVGSNSIGGISANDSSNKLGIGSIGEITSLLYNGTIDEVGIWNRSIIPYAPILYNRGLGLGYNAANIPTFGYDQDVALYLNQLTIQPSQSFISSLTTLVVELKSAGIWKELDRFWIFATEQQQHARVSLVNPTSTNITEVASPTWNANSGYTGNGSTSYLDTNYIPTSNGVNYTQNSASFGFYSITDSVGLNSVEMGCQSNPSIRNAYMYARYTDDNAYIELNVSISPFVFAGYIVTNSLGLYAANRNNASTFTAYKNGALKVTSNQTSTPSPSVSFFILGVNSNGSLAIPSSRRLSIAFIGSGNINQTDFYNIIQRFATRQRFNV